MTKHFDQYSEKLGNQDDNDQCDAMRSEINALKADDPELDGTDGAHPAWWRGHEASCNIFCQKVNDILDGKDDGNGVSNPPWEPTRRRLLAIAEKFLATGGVDYSRGFSDGLREVAQPVQEPTRQGVWSLLSPEGTEWRNSSPQRCIEMAEYAAPVQEPVRFERVKGDTFSDWKKNISKEFYAYGDAVLCWVNEGDIYSLRRAAPVQPTPGLIGYISDNAAFYMQRNDGATHYGTTIYKQPLEGVDVAIYTADPVQPAPQPQFVQCRHGDGGYACCEGRSCEADEHNDAIAKVQTAPLSDRHTAELKALSMLLRNMEGPVTLSAKKIAIADAIDAAIAQPVQGQRHVYDPDESDINQVHESNSKATYETVHYAAPVQPAPLTDGALRDVISTHLTSLYACTRVWGAWQIGTMTEDDFVPASETDFVDDLAAAIQAAIKGGAT